MKILSVNTSELEGGSARAVHRLHNEFLSLGVDSQVLVGFKSTLDNRIHGPNNKIAKGFIKLLPTIDQLPGYFLAHKGYQKIASQWFPNQLANKINSLEPDLINLHWICKGFVQIESISRLEKPIVWTLHDMWPLTGGCFHAGDCPRFQDECGKCPILDSQAELDLSRIIWKRKKRSWKNVEITVVCPSNWMAKNAAVSSLFSKSRIEVIGNGVDTNRYRRVDRAQARAWLGLPKDKILLLYCAVKGPLNPYKGFHYLPAIMRQLQSIGFEDRIELVVLGEFFSENINEIPQKVYKLGHLHDDISIPLVYSAVDAVMVPSDQDNLPNVVMEAMACDTPCVAFDVGGINDLIDHQVNGYIANSPNIEEFVFGIKWIIEKPERYENLKRKARQKIKEKFDIKSQAGIYIQLYKELLANKI